MREIWKGVLIKFTYLLCIWMMYILLGFELTVITGIIFILFNQIDGVKIE